MNKNIIKASAAAILLGAASQYISAQGYTSASLELLKEQRLWFHTSNAAGTVFDNLQNYSVVDLNYSMERGDFHRQQNGYDNKSFKINCEGFLNLDNAYAWGEFNFAQNNKNGSKFNASIADPFRGMPFFMADTHESDWRNQHYNMRFRVGTPVYWGKVAFGIEGAYTAVIAAKQLDPRVDTRYFQLDINPGVAYKINDNHRIGADFQYTDLKEDSRMTNVNLTTAQTYYLLYGLGVALEQIGDGERDDYHGHKVGGGFQYNFSKDKLNLMAAVDYTRRVETLERDPSNPKKDATINDHFWKAGITAHITGKTWSNFMSVSGKFRDMDGIQYINVNNTENGGWDEIYSSIRSTYKTTVLAADYSLLRNRESEYVWRVDAGVEYTKLDDKYIMPASSMDSENLYFHGSASYNFKLGNQLRRRLLVSVNGGYNKNLSGDYVYGGVNADYPTVTELYAMDEAYLTSDYARAGVMAEYSQQFSQTQKMNFFGRASFDYVKARSDYFSHRNYLSFAVGINF